MPEIHFTDADPAKVTIAEEADPRWAQLPDPPAEGEQLFDRWRKGPARRSPRPEHPAGRCGGHRRVSLSPCSAP